MRGVKAAVTTVVLGLLTLLTGCVSTNHSPTAEAASTSPASSTPAADPSTATVASTAGVSPTASPATTEPGPSSPGGSSTQYAGTALVALETLVVKWRAAKTGYRRDQFGAGWVDVDHNSCSTREDILRRDLRAITVRAHTGGCLVASGRLADPYTGRDLAFLRGPTTSGAIQIDHR